MKALLLALLVSITASANAEWTESRLSIEDLYTSSAEVISTVFAPSPNEKYLLGSTITVFKSELTIYRCREDVKTYSIGSSTCEYIYNE
jgi:hypothetical protein